jgi:protein O-GlcNAc transferase
VTGGSGGQVEALARQAYTHHREGRLDAAEALYRRALQVAPDHVEVLWMLGTVRAQRGDLAAAVDHFRRAVALGPDHRGASLDLGRALMASGRTEEAARHLEAVAAAHPGDPEIHDLLASALGLAGRWEGAVAHARQALAARPDPAAHGRLAAVLLGAGRAEEAEEHARKALAGAPENADHHANLGLALLRLGRPEEAIGCFREALRVAPGHAQAAGNLGSAYLSALRPAEAVESLRAAVARHPDLAPGWHNLLFARTYLPELDLKACLEERRAWGDRLLERVRPPAPRSLGPDEAGRVLRVGYLSPDFRAHPVGFFIAPVLAAHDRAAVSVTCYADVAAPDGLTDRMRAAARWRDVRGLTDARVAEQVRADGIDVLVDLTGHAAGTRLGVLAHRPAPLQGGYLGDPLTSGLRTVDFRLTDAWADPPGAERWYTEALARVEGGFCCYVMPYDAPPVAPLPAGDAGAVTFGSLMNPAKINRRTIALWARVLRAVPDARLLLFRHDFASAWLRRRFEAELAAAGVPADRVTCEGRRADNRAYLGVYGRIDVALDTVPFCGHTTTCEALFMGVPVVTLAGRCFAERMGVSLLHQVGLDELAAPDEDAFVATAARLAADLPALEALRAGMRARVTGSRLGDPAGFTAALERTYRDLWTRRCRGEAAGG